MADTDYQARFEEANALVDTGEHGKAEAIYRELLELQSPSAPLLFKLGSAVLGQDRADEAEDLFNQAIEIDPAFPWPHVGRAQVLESRGDFEAATAAIEFALKLDASLQFIPGRIEALRLRAEYKARFKEANALVDSAKHAEAEAIYRELLELGSPSAPLLFKLGSAVLGQGRAEEAEGLFNRAVEVEPTFPWSYVGRAQAFAAKTDFTAAISALEFALKLDSSLEFIPGRIEILRQRMAFKTRFEQANALVDSAEYAEAETIYRQLLELSSHSAPLLFKLGSAVLGQGRAEEAEDLFNRAVEVEPTFPWSYVGRAQAFEAKTDFNAAVAALEFALKLDPSLQFIPGRIEVLRQRTTFKARFEQANALVDSAKYAEAEAIYRQLLELSSHSAPLLFKLGSAVLGQGRAEEAEVLFNQAVEVEPNFPWSYVGRAQAFEAKTDFKAAIAALEFALKLDPSLQFIPGQIEILRQRTAFKARFEQANALVDSAKYAEAEAIYRQLFELSSHSAPLLFKLGSAVLGQGRAEEAEVLFNQAVEVEPTFPWSHVGHAQVFESRGDFEAATAALEFALKLDPSLQFIPGQIEILRQRTAFKARFEQANALVDSGEFRQSVISDPELVSIIIPVFRGNPHLREAIDSALAQTWPSIEVIVVDDGSDDGGETRGIARSFGNRIRYIAKENGGVATALNVGITAMRGRYFSWLSHDDRYHPRKIERQMIALKSVPDTVVVFSDYDLVNESGTFITRVYDTEGFEPAESIWAVLEGRINGCTLLVPRECFDPCGMFDPGLPTTQDYALWFQMVRKFRFVPVRESLVQHRVHSGQRSRTIRHIEEANLLWIRLIDDLTIAEMTKAAGSEMRFLIRVLRRLRMGPLSGARQYIEKKLLAGLASERVALLWVEDEAAEGLEQAIAAIEQAGPTVSEIIILDCSRSAKNSIRLRMRQPLRPTTITRPDRENITRKLAELAEAIAPPYLVIASRHAPLSRGILQLGVEKLVMDEIDGWLSGQSLDPKTCAELPPSLQGAVIRRDSVRAQRGLVETTDSPISLIASARLEVAADDTLGGGSLFQGQSRAKSESGPVSTTASADRQDGATELSERSSLVQPRGALPPGPRTPSQTRDLSHDGFPNAKPPTPRTLLIFVHQIGGGTIRYATQVAQIAKRQIDVLYAWGSDNQQLFISSTSPEDPELSFMLPSDLSSAVRLLHERKVTRADVIHSMGLDQHIMPLMDQLGVPYDMTLVDYYTVAHSPHLMDENGLYVGDRVLSDEKHPLRRPAPVSNLLRYADRRIAISRDTAARFKVMVPHLDFIAARIPEPDKPRSFSVSRPPVQESENFRVLIPGLFAPHKGSAIVLEVARKAWESKAPITFHLLGELSKIPDAGAQRNMQLYGKYELEDLNELICLIRPHVAWMPFSVPETHSFVVTDAMLQGLPILTVGLGAIAERLEGRPSTWVLDPGEASAETYLEWLVRLHREKLKTPAKCPSTAHLPPLRSGFYETEYLARL